MRVGLITNPKSQRNKENAAAIDRAIRDLPDLLVARLSDIAELPEALHRLADELVDVVAVDGGDGTLSATITVLLRARPFHVMPKLCVLPGGMTNLIARDVGPRGERAASLRRLVAAARAGFTAADLVRRPALRLSIGGRPAMFGFFFGGAVVHGATMLSREKFHTIGARQSAATAAGVFGGLASALFDRGEGSLAAGVPMSVRIDGRTLVDAGRHFLILATSLDRLMIGLWPFWNEGEGPIRFYDVAAPPRRLWQAVPTFFTGRPFGWMRSGGYASGRARSIELEIDTPMMLDGEVIRTRGRERVTISADDVVEFVRV